MLLYGRTQMVPQFSFEEAVRFFMDKGFDGVEISALDKQFTPREEFFGKDFPAIMKAAMEEAGVRGYSVSNHREYTLNDEEFELACRTLDQAKALGSSYVIFNGAHKREEQPFEEQYDNMIRKTKALAEYAERIGMKLAMEYEPGFVIDSTPMLLEAFDKINSPAMGINCDIGHVFLCDEDPLRAIELSSPYILQCHVENMAAGVHNHLVPWEGDMDLREYLGKLKECGFDGGLGLDLYAYEYADICEDCAKYFKGIM